MTTSKQTKKPDPLAVARDAVIWGDPPPIQERGPKGNAWDKRLAPLVARPQVWARIGTAGTYANVSARITSVKKSKTLSYDAADFEFAVRSPSGQKTDYWLWARYVAQLAVEADPEVDPAEFGGAPPIAAV